MTRLGCLGWIRFPLLVQQNLGGVLWSKSLLGTRSNSPFTTPTPSATRATTSSERTCGRAKAVNRCARTASASAKRHLPIGAAHIPVVAAPYPAQLRDEEAGRVSCREKVCQYGES